jgi:hypothetical protein
MQLIVMVYQLGSHVNLIVNSGVYFSFGANIRKVASLRLRSGRSLSSAKQRGARIEGCGVASNHGLNRTLRYGLRSAAAYSGCFWKTCPKTEMLPQLSRNLSAVHL